MNLGVDSKDEVMHI